MGKKEKTRKEFSDEEKVTMTINSYNIIAESYAKIYSDEERNKENRDEFMKLVKPKGHILDLGCGHGRDISIFLREGFRATGLDLSDKLLEIAKKNNPQTEFIQQDCDTSHYQKTPMTAFGQAHHYFTYQEDTYLKHLKK